MWTFYLCEFGYRYFFIYFIYLYVGVEGVTKRVTGMSPLRALGKKREKISGRGRGKTYVNEAQRKKVFKSHFWISNFKFSNTFQWPFFHSRASFFHFLTKLYHIQFLQPLKYPKMVMHFWENQIVWNLKDLSSKFVEPLNSFCWVGKNLEEVVHA